MKKQLDDEGTPRRGGAYSKGLRVGDTVWTAGFGPQHPVTGEIPDGIAAQTRQVLQTIAALLASEGLTLDDVVKTTVHLADLDRDFAAYNEEYRKHFSEPLPVRTTVGSTLNGILVEIDVVAVAGAGGRNAG